MNFSKSVTKVRSLKRLTAFRGSLTRDIYFENDATEEWDTRRDAVADDLFGVKLNNFDPLPDEPTDEQVSNRSERVEDAKERALDEANRTMDEPRPQGDCIRIHKARARQSVPVGTRLMSLVGEDLFALFAHSEDDDPDGTGLSSILTTEMDSEDAIKMVLITKIAPLLEEKLITLTDEDRGTYWMLCTLLDGNVGIDGERWTVDELEEHGASLAQLTKMFWTALSLALFPGRGAPATNDGSKGPAAPEKSQAPRTESINGESAKMTGQSVRMSANPG